MDIKITSNFNFSVTSIQYAPNGELQITLSSGEKTIANYVYAANFGDGTATERPNVSLLQYARDYAQRDNIQHKTKDTYRHMCSHLERYGDCIIDKVTTEYLQGFIGYLQSTGMMPNTVRLYFQKLACVLHQAYRNDLFDDRILQRVKRPKKEQQKKCFLSEVELKRLVKHKLSSEYDNIQTMFMFSCMTGLRFSDVQGLRWKDIKRNGKHLQLEFHQQKTDTNERLPLCAEAETILHSMKHNGEYVFGTETNQKANTVLKRWCRKARIKKPVTFHSARHTFCVLLLTNDVPIYTVQQLMCHSDISTTNVYADLLSKTKTKALKKLPVFTERQQ